MIYFILCAILTPLCWRLLRLPPENQDEPIDLEYWDMRTKEQGGTSPHPTEYYMDWDYMNPDKYM